VPVAVAGAVGQKVKRDTGGKIMEQFKLYITQRVILGVLFVVIALWAISFFIGFLGKPAHTGTAKEVATHGV
jgi:hypothetical protein